MSSPIKINALKRREEQGKREVRQGGGRLKMNKNGYKCCKTH
jgi:hypothetical protein